MIAFRTILFIALCWLPLAGLAAPGDVDPAFDPNVTGVAGTTSVNAVAGQPDGKLVIGGAFTAVGGTPRNNLARLNADGSLDVSFDPNITGTINAVAIQFDGKIVAAGAFTAAGGLPRNNIARFNADGSVDPAFDPNLNGSVQAVAALPMGAVLIGGAFTTVAATAQSYLARLHSDGSLDSGFNPSNGVSLAQVDSFALQSDGKIIVGIRRASLALVRVNANCTVLDTSFSVGALSGTSFATVRSIAVQDDGRILIAGQFSASEGTSGYINLARYKATGALDVLSVQAFSPRTGVLAVQLDGKILFSGIRADNMGGMDLEFRSFSGNPYLQSDGSVIVAGSFTSTGGVPRNNIARLINGPAAQSLTAAPSDIRVQWLRAGTAPPTPWTTFELSTDGGTTWNLLGAGSTIPGGWELTGLSLPQAGQIRGRASLPTGGFAESILTLAPDSTTAPATVLSPVQGAASPTLPISYFLPEVPLSGSVKLTLTNSSQTLVLGLAAALESAGVHAFTIDPAHPINSSVVSISGGSTIPDGQYTLTLTYRDWLGNPASATSVAAVSVDHVTQTPSLTSPLSGSPFSGNIPIGFVLPEDARFGTVTLKFTAGTIYAYSYDFTLADSFVSAGGHFLNFNAIDVFSSGEVGGGSARRYEPAIQSYVFGPSNFLADNSYTVTISYQDKAGNPVAVSSGIGLSVDHTTIAPNLQSPAANSAIGTNIPVSFWIEQALAGSLHLTFVNGSNSYGLDLASSQESGGSHAFSFDPRNPLASPEVAAGVPIPDGTYTVTLSYSDYLGNAPASASIFNVTIDTIAAAPSLTPPFDAATYDIAVPVSFTLGERAKPGSLRLEFSTAQATYQLTLASSQETVGTHSFSFNPTNPTATVQIAAGGPIPNGTYSVKLTYQDAVGNVGTSVSVDNVMIQVSPPVLAYPSAISVEATGPSGAMVTYAASASDGAASVTSFTATPASGSTFPIGTTVVQLMAVDDNGSVARGSFPVTVQDTTPPVVSTSTLTVQATSPAGALVNFGTANVTDAVGVTSVTYDPPSGSVFPFGASQVTVSARDAANNVGLGSFTVSVVDTTSPVVTPPNGVSAEATSPAGANVTYGNAIATDAVGVVSISYSNPSGSMFPLGNTIVTVTARDPARNSGTATFTVTVRDTTAPTISGTFSPLKISPGPLPDYTGQAVANDAVGVASVTQSPTADSIVSVGTTQVTLTASDAAGNHASTSFSVEVKVGQVTSVQHTVLWKTGDTAPGAGGSPGPTAGATLTTFGSPAIDQDGTVAFVGNWSNGDGSKGSGVFKGSTPFAVAGDAALDGNGTTYASFGDPIIAGGRVALLAKLAGGPKDGASALVSGLDPASFGVYARTGSADAAPDTPYGRAGRFRKFTSIAADGGAVAFLGQLSVGYGSPNTDASNDSGIWLYEGPGAAGKLLLREGEQVDGHTITRFVAFQPGNGSPGQGRGWLRTIDGDPSVMVLAYFGKEYRQAVLSVNSQGVATTLVETGPAPFQPINLFHFSFTSFGVPTLSQTGSLGFVASVIQDERNAAFRRTQVGCAKYDSGWKNFASAHSFIVNSSVVVESLKDPVMASDGGNLAFRGTITSRELHVAHKPALLWSTRGESPAPLALLGSQPPGAPATRWKTFSSLATAANRGPVFTATLSLNGSTATAQGAWAIDSDGMLRLLFRTGVPFDLGGGVTKKLTRFSFLNANVGTTAMTRSFNDAGQFAWRATFDDKSQAIVLTEIP